METHYLSPDEMIFRHENRSVLLDLAGERYEDVQLCRAFPLSDPSRYVIVKDSCGKEIGIIRDISELSGDQKKIVRRVLEDRYFMPIIESVEYIREQFGAVTWKVNTDRGPRTFRTRDRRKSVTELKDGRILITDADSNRYEIKGLESLDQRSQSLLGRLF